MFLSKASERSEQDMGREENCGGLRLIDLEIAGPQMMRSANIYMVARGGLMDHR